MLRVAVSFLLLVLFGIQVHAAGLDADLRCVPEGDYTCNFPATNAKNGKQCMLSAPCTDTTNGKKTTGVCTAANVCTGKTSEGEDGKPEELSKTPETGQTKKPTTDTNENSNNPAPVRQLPTQKTEENSSDDVVRQAEQGATGGMVQQPENSESEKGTISRVWEGVKETAQDAAHYAADTVLDAAQSIRETGQNIAAKISETLQGVNNLSPDESRGTQGSEPFESVPPTYTPPSYTGFAPPTIEDPGSITDDSFESPTQQTQTGFESSPEVGQGRAEAIREESAIEERAAETESALRRIAMEDRQALDSFFRNNFGAGKPISDSLLARADALADAALESTADHADYVRETLGGANIQDPRVREALFGKGIQTIEPPTQFASDAQISRAQESAQASAAESLRAAEQQLSSLRPGDNETLESVQNNLRALYERGAINEGQIQDILNKYNIAAVGYGADTRLVAPADISGAALQNELRPVLVESTAIQNVTNENVRTQADIVRGAAAASLNRFGAFGDEYVTPLASRLAERATMQAASEANTLSHAREQLSTLSNSFDQKSYFDPSRYVGADVYALNQLQEQIAKSEARITQLQGLRDVLIDPQLADSVAQAFSRIPTTPYEIAEQALLSKAIADRYQSKLQLESFGEYADSVVESPNANRGLQATRENGLLEVFDRIQNNYASAHNVIQQFAEGTPSESLRRDIESYAGNGSLVQRALNTMSEWLHGQSKFSIESVESTGGLYNFAAGFAANMVDNVAYLTGLPTNAQIQDTLTLGELDTGAYGLGKGISLTTDTVLFGVGPATRFGEALLAGKTAEAPAALGSIRPSFVDNLVGLEARAARGYMDTAIRNAESEIGNAIKTQGEFQTRVYQNMHENIARSDLVATGQGKNVLNALEAEMKTIGIEPRGGYVTDAVAASSRGSERGLVSSFRERINSWFGGGADDTATVATRSSAAETGGTVPARLTFDGQPTVTTAAREVTPSVTRPTSLSSIADDIADVSPRSMSDLNNVLARVETAIAETNGATRAAYENALTELGVAQRLSLENGQGQHTARIATALRNASDEVGAVESVPKNTSISDATPPTIRSERVPVNDNDPIPVAGTPSLNTGIPGIAGRNSGPAFAPPSEVSTISTQRGTFTPSDITRNPELATYVRSKAESLQESALRAEDSGNVLQAQVLADAAREIDDIAAALGRVGRVPVPEIDILAQVRAIELRSTATPAPIARANTFFSNTVSVLRSLTLSAGILLAPSSVTLETGALRSLAPGFSERLTLSNPFSGPALARTGAEIPVTIQGRVPEQKTIPPLTRNGSRIKIVDEANNPLGITAYKDKFSDPTTGIPQANKALGGIGVWTSSNGVPYAQFKSVSEALATHFFKIESYIKNGQNTPRKIVERYVAPDKDHPYTPAQLAAERERYLTTLARYGFSPDEVLSTQNVSKIFDLAEAQSCQEQSLCSKWYDKNPRYPNPTFLPAERDAAQAILVKAGAVSAPGPLAAVPIATQSQPQKVLTSILAYAQGRALDTVSPDLAAQGLSGIKKVLPQNKSILSEISSRGKGSFIRSDGMLTDLPGVTFIWDGRLSGKGALSSNVKGFVVHYQDAGVKVNPSVQQARNVISGHNDRGQSYPIYVTDELDAQGKVIAVVGGPVNRAGNHIRDSETSSRGFTNDTTIGAMCLNTGAGVGTCSAQQFSAMSQIFAALKAEHPGIVAVGHGDIQSKGSAPVSSWAQTFLADLRAEVKSVTAPQNPEGSLEAKYLNIAMQDSTVAQRIADAGKGVLSKVAAPFKKETKIAGLPETVPPTVNRRAPVPALIPASAAPSSVPVRTAVGPEVGQEDIALARAAQPYQPGGIASLIRDISKAPQPTIVASAPQTTLPAPTQNASETAVKFVQDKIDTNTAELQKAQSTLLDVQKKDSVLAKIETDLRSALDLSNEAQRIGKEAQAQWSIAKRDEALAKANAGLGKFDTIISAVRPLTTAANIQELQTFRSQIQKAIQDQNVEGLSTVKKAEAAVRKIVGDTRSTITSARVAVQKLETAKTTLSAELEKVRAASVETKVAVAPTIPIPPAATIADVPPPFVLQTRPNQAPLSVVKPQVAQPPAFETILKNASLQPHYRNEGGIGSGSYPLSQIQALPQRVVLQAHESWSVSNIKSLLDACETAGKQCAITMYTEAKVTTVGTGQSSDPSNGVPIKNRIVRAWNTLQSARNLGPTYAARIVPAIEFDGFDEIAQQTAIQYASIAREQGFQYLVFKNRPISAVTAIERESGLKAVTGVIEDVASNPEYKKWALEWAKERPDVPLTLTLTNRTNTETSPRAAAREFQRFNTVSVVWSGRGVNPIEFKTAEFTNPALGSILASLSEKIPVTKTPSLIPASAETPIRTPTVPRVEALNVVPPRTIAYPPPSISIPTVDVALRTPLSYPLPQPLIQIPSIDTAIATPLTYVQQLPSFPVVVERLTQFVAPIALRDSIETITRAVTLPGTAPAYPPQLPRIDAPETPFPRVAQGEIRLPTQPPVRDPLPPTNIPPVIPVGIRTSGTQRTTTSPTPLLDRVRAGISNVIDSFSVTRSQTAFSRGFGDMYPSPASIDPFASRTTNSSGGAGGGTPPMVINSRQFFFETLPRLQPLPARTGFVGILAVLGLSGSEKSEREPFAIEIIPARTVDIARLAVPEWLNRTVTVITNPSEGNDISKTIHADVDILPPQVPLVTVQEKTDNATPSASPAIQENKGDIFVLQDPQGVPIMTVRGDVIATDTNGATVIQKDALQAIINKEYGPFPGGNHPSLDDIQLKPGEIVKHVVTPEGNVYTLTIASQSPEAAVDATAPAASGDIPVTPRAPESERVAVRVPGARPPTGAANGRSDDSATPFISPSRSGTTSNTRPTSWLSGFASIVSSLLSAFTPTDTTATSPQAQTVSPVLILSATTKTIKHATTTVLWTSQYSTSCVFSDGLVTYSVPVSGLVQQQLATTTVFSVQCQGVRGDYIRAFATTSVE